MIASKYANLNLNRLSKGVPVIIAENPILCLNMIWRFAADFKKIHGLLNTVGDTGITYLYLYTVILTTSLTTQILPIKLNSKFNRNNIYHLSLESS